MNAGIPHPHRYGHAELRAALDRHAMLCVVDATGIVIEVNALFCATSGYTVDELIGQSHRIFDAGRHLPAFFEDMWRTLEAERVWCGKVCNRRKDGGTYWVQTTVSLFDDADGRPHILTLSTDISALVEAEEAARRSARTLTQTCQLLSEIVQGDPVPTFVIDASHVVTHWNRGCEYITGLTAAQIVGTRDHWRPFYPSARPLMADLILDRAPEAMFRQYYQDRFHASPCIEEAWEAEGFFPNCGENGCWLHFTAAPLRNIGGEIIGAVEILQDITGRKNAEKALRDASADLERQVEQRTAELLRRYHELAELTVRLGQMQDQLLQSEKLASIGQLAAGVAHEINNPIGYVHSNVNSLSRHLEDLLKILDGYLAAESTSDKAAALAEAGRLKEQLNLGYLREDLVALLEESKEGIRRVRQIVQDLKNFSRIDAEQSWEHVDIHKGLDSTLNMVFNEIKYKADVIKDYGDLPEIECLPSQLNQVFMNLIVNAAHAMDGEKRGKLTLKTGRDRELVWIEVSDTGSGIAPENLKKIFDPFFTTKPVGQGTGLGLSLSYGIVMKHGGSLDVRSTVGQGTTFRVTLPVSRPAAPQTAEG